MQPKDFEEELANSAEKVEKRRRRHNIQNENVLVNDTPEMKDENDKLERLRVKFILSVPRVYLFDLFHVHIFKLIIKIYSFYS